MKRSTLSVTLLLSCLLTVLAAAPAFAIPHATTSAAIYLDTLTMRTDSGASITLIGNQPSYSFSGVYRTFPFSLESSRRETLLAGWGTTSAEVTTFPPGVSAASHAATSGNLLQTDIDATVADGTYLFYNDTQNYGMFALSANGTLTATFDYLLTGRTGDFAAPDYAGYLSGVAISIYDYSTGILHQAIQELSSADPLNPDGSRSLSGTLALSAWFERGAPLFLTIESTSQLDMGAFAAPIPEPSTAVLAGSALLGAAGIAAVRRRHGRSG